MIIDHEALLLLPENSRNCVSKRSIFTRGTPGTLLNMLIINGFIFWTMINSHQILIITHCRSPAYPGILPGYTVWCLNCWHLSKMLKRAGG